jgi:succinylglutamate desuccinylase
MRTIGSVNANHVENRHDRILIEYSSNLPKVSTLFDRYEIIPGSGFKMMPNYQNFQKVRKGEIIARDNNGEIKASDDGLILMPLYQEKGEDGFFLVREKKSFDFA